MGEWKRSRNAATGPPGGRIPFSLVELINIPERINLAGIVFLLINDKCRFPSNQG